MSPVDQLTVLLDGYERILAGIAGEQWSSKSPCTEWTVHDVANHLQMGNLRATQVLTGREPDPAPGAGLPDRDLLGDRPVAAFREVADELLAAFGQPDVMERMVTLPIGTIPGAVALGLRTVELTVHGWDLATATGQTPAFPDDAVAQALAFTQGMLDRIPAERKPFGTPQPVADDAPPLDRLVALLGRSVG